MAPTSSLRVAYKSFPATPLEPFPNRQFVHRPVIDILLVFGKKSIEYQVLIDSGADFCIFHTEMAEILGIPITQGKKMTFYGTSGTPQTAYFHDVHIEVSGWPMKLYCGFSSDMKSLPYGLLGQTGFFDRFKIEFDYQAKRIELKLKRQ